MKDKQKTLSSNRRDFLKILSAVGGTASLTPWMTACSTVPKNALAPAPKELLAPEVKVVNTYHELHCHGQCMLKTHIRDGRILAITSAGDVPRCEAKQNR